MIRKLITRLISPYLAEHPYIFISAVGAFLTGVGYLIQIATGAWVANPILYDQAVWTQIIWALTYALGGAGTALGIFLEHPDFEAPGLAMLSAAVAIAVALTIVTTGNWLSIFSGGFIAIAAAVRAVLVTIRSRRYVVAREQMEDRPDA